MSADASADVSADVSADQIGAPNAIPYLRENKPCLFKTHAVFGRAYFRAMLIFET